MNKQDLMLELSVSNLDPKTKRLLRYLVENDNTLDLVLAIEEFSKLGAPLTDDEDTSAFALALKTTYSKKSIRTAQRIWAKHNTVI